MEINVESKQNVSPGKLAEALSEASANDFAEFWFIFSDKCTKQKLEDFARAMAQDFGGRRKEPLTELYNLMKYYELKNKYEKND